MKSATERGEFARRVKGALTDSEGRMLRDLLLSVIAEFTRDRQSEV